MRSFCADCQYALNALNGCYCAMLNRYGVSCPVVTVPTGIDLTAFGPAKDNGEEKARMRAELGIPEGDTVLLSLGRLAAEKNHAQLVRLLAAQPEQSRPWLVFVGDGPARPDLEALTRELKLTDRVRFAGMVKPDEVPRWYRVGDIFVSASQSETQGLTYFEGMACGLPVLCRADPCLDGVVENGFNGWQWKDEAEFASALNTIISDPALRGQLHQNALATAARYSAEHFAQQVLDAYQQAIALKHYFRAWDTSAANPEDVARFPELKLVSIDDFGGWAKVQPEHFGDGGIFDQIYVPK